MARFTVAYLSEAEREFIHEQTLRVLEEVGVAYNLRQAIDLLGEAGAQVDRAALTAKLPRELVLRCIETAPRRVLLAARDPAHDVWLDGSRLSFTTDGTGTYLIDDVTGERRTGTLADLGAVMRLFDALPEIDYVWPSLLPRDADERTLGLEVCVTGLRNCAKHLQDEVLTRELARPILAVLEAIAGAPLGERPIYSAINCTIAPLQHDPAMTEASLELIKHGIPIIIMPMGLMGTTAPMSVVGASILNMAEMLSALVLYQVAEPGCPCVSSIGSAAAEMRSGLYLSDTPEVGLINVICTEMSRGYELPTEATGLGADAKAANFQAGAESMMTGLACALAGADSIVAIGLLDGAQIVSPAKVVLDCDSVGAIRRLLRETVVDDRATLFDDVAAVGPGGHFLSRRSTRERYRGGELWQPALWQRGPFDSFVGQGLLEDAAGRARDLMTNHRPQPLPDDVERELARIVASHKAGLGH